MDTTMGSGTEPFGLFLPNVQRPSHCPRLRASRTFELRHSGAFLGVMPRALNRCAICNVEQSLVQHHADHCLDHLGFAGINL